jgi:alkylation response protein AidB-like acyl-CoA dehydrogenase
MNLLPDDDQRELVDAVHAVLQRQFDPRRILGEDRGRPDADEWRDLAALGWFGIGLSEACGGTGLGPAEEMLIFTEFGRSLFSGPALGTVLGAHACAVAGEEALAGRIAGGETTVGLFVGSAGRGHVVNGLGSELTIDITPKRCRVVETSTFREAETIDCIDVLDQRGMWPCSAPRKAFTARRS